MSEYICKETQQKEKEGNRRFPRNLRVCVCACCECIRVNVLKGDRQRVREAKRGFAPELRMCVCV